MAEENLEQLLSNLKEEMQTILSDQSKLKEQMQNNLKYQSKLNEEMLNNLRDQSKMNERIQSIFIRLQCKVLSNDNFPLKNDVDLKDIEEKVSDKNSTFTLLLVGDLTFIGGKDLKDMVTNSMNQLFTVNLISGYSFKGGHKSLIFSKLNIYKNVIFDAIIKQFSNTPETVKEFKEAIVNHLRASRKSL